MLVCTLSTISDDFNESFLRSLEYLPIFKESQFLSRYAKVSQESNESLFEPTEKSLDPLNSFEALWGQGKVNTMYVYLYCN